MSDAAGFLARWSRRKVEVREGRGVPAVPAPVVVPAAVPVTTPAGAATPAQDGAALAPPPPVEAPPAPTLADVAQLTRDSDYARFVAADVDTGVKNAALKKLFGDPHFNLMDGLDTYIDDYGKPAPLPAGVLQKMVQARLLGLFDGDAEAASPATPSTSPIATDPATLPDPAAHEDTDLRLQPHDAAGRAGAEPGARPDAGREH